ncbi:hypothetical protein CL634_03245 [bacterium]|nr:hypothetical protein [bacterium]
MLGIILAGGEGTRLRPLTYTVPKPLIDVQGKTLTEQVIDLLKSFGVSEIVLSLGYMAEKIKDHFGDGSKFGIPISYLIEEKQMGTAGPLLLLREKKSLPKTSFMMVNGDNLFNVNYKAWSEVHKRHSSVATIALTKVEDPSSRGAVKVEGNKITEFAEKPKEGRAPSNLVSSGYYILSPDIFQYLPDGDHVMMETNIFPALASAGKLYGYADEGQWFDTGTPERYEQVKNKWKPI